MPQHTTTSHLPARSSGRPQRHGQLLREPPDLVDRRPGPEARLVVRRTEGPARVEPGHQGVQDLLLRRLARAAAVLAAAL